MRWLNSSSALAGGSAMLAQQELAGCLEVGGRGELLPVGLRWFRRLRGDDAGAHGDRQRRVGTRDAELDHVGAEVVAVAAEPRLRVDVDVELVNALIRGGGRAHTQRVQVVRDGRVVEVLGGVIDREVHCLAWSVGAQTCAVIIMRSAGATPPKRRSEMSASASASSEPTLSRRSRVGRPARRRHCERGSQGRRGSARGAGRGRSCRGAWSASSSASRTAPIEAATESEVARREEQEARDARGARCARGGAPIGLQAAYRLQQRERLPVAHGARVVSGALLLAGRGERDAQHPQHHVGALEAPARVEEGIGLVAEHGARRNAPEERRAVPST